MPYTLLLRKTGLRVRVSPEDLPDLQPYNWYLKRNKRSAYVCRNANPGEIMEGSPYTIILPRMLYAQASGGPLTRRDIIVHRNGNPLDCRRDNLVLLPKGHDIQGRTRYTYCGVQPTGTGSYIAQIVHQRTRYHLGQFPTPLMAAHAYNAAAKDLFGPHATLNPVDPR